jgi:hypothetical protein
LAKRQKAVGIPKMKNLLTYTDPLKRFVKNLEDLTKMQIDNSFELGWEKEDIILATNFPYEYKGIKSVIIGTYETFDNNRSTKIPVINELFEKGLIEDGQIYWFHDHDAFQLVPLEVKLERDAGFTTYRGPTWNAGSFFFKKSTKDIFLDIWKYMNLRGTNEQDALTYMWEKNINDINSRYHLMNITFNMGLYNLVRNFKEADLPVRVAHFHPHKKRHLDLFKSRQLLPERLLTIFSKYGIKS